MATYRSRRSSQPDSAAHRTNRWALPVSSQAYLLARGDAYAATYVPEAFVCLSESIDLHTVDASRIRVPVTLVGILEDQLIPISDLRSLRARLGGEAALVELSSLYGHDAFLKEGAALEPVFARALAGQAGKP
jgi:homoserine O-acetyltransferase